MSKKIIALALALILIFPSLTFAKEDESKYMDWDQEIIYMVLTDRFYDGDPSNNDVSSVEGSYDKDHLEAYHGGDFRGIIEKVDYLKDLGITTLWITPIVKNIETNMRASQGDKQFGYHGYWAEDFTEIDLHLGNEDDLKELIDVLHDNGIKLMVDVVLNHSGYGMEDQPQFAGMFREEGYGDILGSLAGLPDFATEKPEVRQKLIDWQVDWLDKLRTKKGNSIDYFRVDTVKHVEPDTWKDFKTALVAKDPNFKLIGENFDASIFNTGNYLSPDMMDSLLDFDFKNIAKDFAQGRVDKAEKNLVRRNEAITREMLMGQFLSSHDEHGFLAMKLGGDVDKFLPAVSLQLTAKGQPVIYYGEEIGQSGQKDNFDKGIYSENRYDFDWEKIDDNNILDHYKKLIEIRKTFAPIFSEGERRNLLIKDGVSVFSRYLDGQQVIVALNTNSEPKQVSFEMDNIGENYRDLYNDKSVKVSGNTMTVDIPANAYGGTSILVTDSMAPADYLSRSSLIESAILALILSAGISYIFFGRKKNK